MPPPQLAADAPVLNVAHPGEIGVFPGLRHELDAAAAHGLNRRAGQSLRIDVPLPGQEGFDNDPAAIPARNLQTVIVDTLKQTALAHVLNHLVARCKAIQAPIGLGGLRVDGRVGIENVDQRQAVALADRVVVEIVRRGDLDAAGAEFGIDAVVGDDRDQAIAQGQGDLLADPMPVARVVGVHRHRAVPEQGFRARGGHAQMSAALGQRVAKTPQAPRFFFRDHFQIGDRRVQLRVPVHQALAAVNQPLAIQADKGFPNRAGQPLVHREALRRPVRRCAQAAQLPGNRAPGTALPGPDFIDKGVAADGLPIAARGGQLPLDHHLRGDTGVVRADLPQGVVTRHAPIADQHIDERGLKAVAHVQAAGDVGRRDHNAVRLVAALGREVPGVFPAPIPARLYGCGLKGFVHGVERVAGGGSSVAAGLRRGARLYAAHAVLFQCAALFSIVPPGRAQRLQARRFPVDQFGDARKAGEERRHPGLKVDQQILVAVRLLAPAEADLLAGIVADQGVGQKTGRPKSPQSFIQNARLCLVLAVQEDAMAAAVRFFHQAQGQALATAGIAVAEDVKVDADQTPARAQRYRVSRPTGRPVAPLGLEFQAAPAMSRCAQR